MGTTPGVLLICTFSQVSLRSSSSWTTSPSITRRSTRLRLSFLAATISSAQSLLPTTPGTELACAGPTLRKRRPKSSTLTVSRFDRSHPAEADETLPRRQLGNDPLLPPSPSRAPVQGPRQPSEGGDAQLRDSPRVRDRVRTRRSRPVPRALRGAFVPFLPRRYADISDSGTSTRRQRRRARHQPSPPLPLRPRRPLVIELSRRQYQRLARARWPRSDRHKVAFQGSSSGLLLSLEAR